MDKTYLVAAGAITLASSGARIPFTSYGIGASAGIYCCVNF